MRIFNTYGPRMHPNDGRVVSNFIVQALRGEPITIYGDGEQTRSFCYVDDLIEGMIRLMETDEQYVGPGQPRQPGRVHDAGAGRGRDRADRLASRKLVHQPLPPDDPKQRRPTSPARGELLGWQPAIQLEEGLTRTIAYFDRLLSTGVRPTEVSPAVER